MPERKPESPQSSTVQAMRTAQPYLDASWQLIGAVGLCTLGGWWLDKRFGTTPWLLVGGAMVGLAAGMVSFVRVVVRMSEIEKAAREKREKDGTAK